MKKHITKKELLHKNAALESLNDHLAAELEYIDQLMRQAGFTDGIETVKATAHELLLLENEDLDNEEAA